MPYEFLEGRPFWVVYCSLLGIVLARAQATYWIGRGLGAGVHRSRFAERVGPRMAKAEELINRFGPPAVTLSFMTVGIQTAVNLAAGGMRMRFHRYLIAMFLGCLLWSAIYSLGGMAVLAAWWHLFLRSPLLAVTAVILVAAVIAVIIRFRRASATRTQPEPQDHDEQHSPDALR